MLTTFQLFRNHQLWLDYYLFCSLVFHYLKFVTCFNKNGLYFSQNLITQFVILFQLISQANYLFVVNLTQCFILRLKNLFVNSNFVLEFSKDLSWFNMFFGFCLYTQSDNRLCLLKILTLLDNFVRDTNVSFELFDTILQILWVVDLCEI